MKLDDVKLSKLPRPLRTGALLAAAALAKYLHFNDWDRASLYQPLRYLARKDGWKPPVRVARVVKRKDVQRIVGLFIEYWESEKCFTAVKDLRLALEKFSAAETRILGLSADGPCEWDGCFKTLCEAREQIARCLEEIPAPYENRTLKDIWRDVSTNRRGQLEGDSDALLAALGQNDSGLYRKVEEARTRLLNELDAPENARLSQGDLEPLWAFTGDKREFQRRFEIHQWVDDAMRADNVLSLARVIADTLWFKELVAASAAEGGSADASSPARHAIRLATSRWDQRLAGTGESDVETLIEQHVGDVLPGVDGRYAPSAAGALLRAHTLISDAASRSGIDVPDKRIEVCDGYRSHYLGYWCAEYPEQRFETLAMLPQGSWKDCHGWLGGTMQVPSIVDCVVTISQEFEPALKAIGCRRDLGTATHKQVWVQTLYDLRARWTGLSPRPCEARRELLADAAGFDGRYYALAEAGDPVFALYVNLNREKPDEVWHALHDASLNMMLDSGPIENASAISLVRFDGLLADSQASATDGRRTPT